MFFMIQQRYNYAFNSALKLTGYIQLDIASTVYAKRSFYILLRQKKIENYKFISNAMKGLITILIIARKRSTIIIIINHRKYKAPNAFPCVQHERHSNFVYTSINMYKFHSQLKRGIARRLVHLST